MTYISPVLTQEFTANYGMVVVYDKILLADAANFDVQNIPQNYKYLVLEYQGRTSNATTVQVQMRFNNDSGANYGTQLYQANAATNVPSDLIGATQFRVGNIPGTSSGASGSGTIKIPNYDLTTFPKIFSAAGGYYEGISEDSTILNQEWGWWNNTAAITRITLLLSAGNWIAGSRLTIYGLAGAPAGTPGTELGYTEFTSNITISSADGNNPNDIVSAPAYTYDGATKICIETYLPIVECANTDFIQPALWDGNTRLGDFSSVALSGSRDLGQLYRRYITPTQGSHTYRIRAYRGSANGTIYAGTGASGTYMPGYIRIVTV